MDVTQISQAVATMGFPTVWAFIMFYYVNKLQTSHKDEIEKLSANIEKNSELLIELKNLITFKQ